ncbi:MAG TPA: hypothetical protein PLE92_04060, partial [Lentisphaeria bacterium]|nr:hypothetical protein [Lentisphaeria bacterium]
MRRRCQAVAPDAGRMMARQRGTGRFQAGGQSERFVLSVLKATATSQPERRCEHETEHHASQADP